MHYTEEQEARKNMGTTLVKSGWTLFGWSEDRSEFQAGYQCPASWAGVATHPDHEGYVLVVKGFNSKYQNQKEWPTFTDTLRGKAWHLEKNGKIVASGVGLNRCKGYSEEQYGPGCNKMLRAIEKALGRTGKKSPTSEGADSFALAGIDISYIGDWTWVRFPGKPSKRIRDELKKMGGFWARKREAWGFKSRIPDKDFAWIADSPAILPAYDYLPADVLARLPPLYSTEKNVPVVQVKYFLPQGRWTFFATEYSKVAPDGTPDMFFGYLLSPLEPAYDELCYMSLSQIEGLRTKTDLKVERDLWFKPGPLSEFKEEVPPEPETKSDLVLEFFQDGDMIGYKNSNFPRLYLTALPFEQDGKTVSFGWKAHYSPNEETPMNPLKNQAGGTIIGKSRRLTVQRIEDALYCHVILTGEDIPDEYPYPDNKKLKGKKLITQEDLDVLFEETRKKRALAAAKVLPKQWTREDIDFLLGLAKGEQWFLLAEESLGIPTIHDKPLTEGSRMISGGILEVATDEYKIGFEAGGLMRRTPSGNAWSPLRVDSGRENVPYDLADVKAKLESWLETPEEPEPVVPEPVASKFASLYYDWMSTTDGRISASPSHETLEKYDRWAKELLMGGKRGREGADFRRFCRVRLEGKARGLVDLEIVGKAFSNGKDYPAPEGWECLGKPPPPYTDEDVAEYESEWDLWLEGAPRDAKKKIKSIESLGVLRAALERVKYPEVIKAVELRIKGLSK